MGISNYQGVLGMLNTEYNIYLGGAPDLTTLTGGRWDAGFQGCVYNITFYGEDVDFSSESGEKIISTANIRPCETLSTKEDEVRYIAYLAATAIELPLLSCFSSLIPIM